MNYTDILCALRSNYTQGRKICLRATLDRLKAHGLCPAHAKRGEITPIQSVLIALGAMGHIFVTPKMLADNAQAFTDAGAMVAGELPLASIRIQYERLNGGPLSSIESLTIAPDLLAILANEWECRHGSELTH